MFFFCLGRRIIEKFESLRNSNRFGCTNSIDRDNTDQLDIVATYVHTRIWCLNVHKVWIGTPIIFEQLPKTFEATSNHCRRNFESRSMQIQIILDALTETKRDTAMIGQMVGSKSHIDTHLYLHLTKMEGWTFLPIF